MVRTVFRNELKIRCDRDELCAGNERRNEQKKVAPEGTNCGASVEERTKRGLKWIQMRDINDVCFTLFFLSFRNLQISF